MKTIKKNYSKITLLGLFAAIFMVSCSSPKTMSSAIQKIKIKAEPENLEVKDDSITIKITGRIPAKTFVKNASVKFQPTLRYGGEKKLLASKYCVGEEITGIKRATKINFEKGGAFTYYQRVEYTPEMRKSIITIDYTVKFVARHEERSKYASGTMKDSISGNVTTALTVSPSNDQGTDKNTTTASGPHQTTLHDVVDGGNLKDSVTNDKHNPRLYTQK